MKQKKSPKLALLLNCLIPGFGLGHLYLGRPGKFLLWAVLWISVISWPFAIIDAWETAEKINQEAYKEEMAAKTARPGTAARAA